MQVYTYPLVSRKRYILGGFLFHPLHIVNAFGIKCKLVSIPFSVIFTQWLLLNHLPPAYTTTYTHSYIRRSSVGPCKAKSP